MSTKAHVHFNEPETCTAKVIQQPHVFQNMVEQLLHRGPRGRRSLSEDPVRPTVMIPRATSGAAIVSTLRTAVYICPVLVTALH